MKPTSFALLFAVAVAACATDETTITGKVEQKVTVGSNRYVADSSGDFQSEQSLVVVNQNGVRKLLAGVNDYNQDAWMLLSTSTDVTVQPIQWSKSTIPHDSSITHLNGDPWLVANRGTGPSDVTARTRVYYVTIAHALDGVGDDHSYLGIAQSWDGGQNWGAGFTRIDDATGGCSNRDHDKPAVETNADGTKVWVSYICVNTGEIRVLSATTNGMAFGSWTDALVASNVHDTTTAFPSPVIKQDLLNPPDIYVLYEDGMPGVRNIMFTMSPNAGVSFQAPVPAVTLPSNDPPFLAESMTTIRSRIHFSFIFDPGNYHCIVAYDADGALGVAGTVNGLNWNDPPPHPIISQDEMNMGWKYFQPFLAGSPVVLAIAAYRQQHMGLATDNVTSVRGLISSDHGYTFTSTMDLSQCGVFPAGMGGMMYTPCPPSAANFVPCPMHWPAPFFGDYIGLTPLVSPGEDWSWLSYDFYAAWTDSRPSPTSACSYTPMTPNSQNMHTVGQLFSFW